jgi:hypothetical protein
MKAEFFTLRPTLEEKLFGKKLSAKQKKISCPLEMFLV